MQLFLALARQVFAQRVFNVLLREEDIHARKRCIVGCHAVVLQSRNGLHTLLRHVLLGQYDGELLGAVVAEVDEDDDVTLFDETVDAAVVDRFDELVGDTFVVALLHGSNHIGSLLALTFY